MFLRSIIASFFFLTLSVQAANLADFVGDWSSTVWWRADSGNAVPFTSYASLKSDGSVLFERNYPGGSIDCRGTAMIEKRETPRFDALVVHLNCHGHAVVYELDIMEPVPSEGAFYTMGRSSMEEEPYLVRLERM